MEKAAIIFKDSVVGDNRIGKDSVGENMDGQATNTKYKDLSQKHIKMLEKYRIYNI